MIRQFTEIRMDMKNDPWVGIEANTDFFDTDFDGIDDVSVCNSPWYQITDQWTFQEQAYYSQTTLQLEFDIFGAASVLGFLIIMLKNIMQNIYLQFLYLVLRQI